MPGWVFRVNFNCGHLCLNGAVYCFRPGPEALQLLSFARPAAEAGVCVVLDSYADRWALVTGASSGIGEAFARLLAARGMHLILVSRRTELLDALASELLTRHGTRCEVVTCDLSEPGQPQWLFNEIAGRGIDVELLINNAGFGFVGVVEDTNPERMQEMVRLNVGAVTGLTYLFLPGMLKRQHGAIINVASIAAFQPVAYMPVYAATKAFVLHFSEALWAECRDRKVTVMALCPGTTATGFFDVAGVSGWLRKHRSQTVEYVTRKAMKALERRRQYVVPGFGNLLLSLSVRLARRKMVVLQSMRFFRPRNK